MGLVRPGRLALALTMPVAVAAAGAVAAPARAQQAACPGAPAALVLSGGGARGFAHIGVLAELERRHIRPGLVVGTSIGAIIGGLWASGYSAAAIDSLVRRYPLAGLFTRFDPRRPQVLGGLQPLVTWTLRRGGFALAANVVREEPVNAFLDALMLRGNLLARGDFDRLPIPFRAVATRLADGRAVVLAGGDLAQAVRASAAIPLVFPPATIGDTQLVDGGLAANVPVALARRALGGRAGRLVVSDVSHGRADTADLGSPIRIAGHLLSYLTSQPADTLQPGDVYIRPAPGTVRMLDFAPAKLAGLVAAGRAAADSALGALHCDGNGDERAAPPPARLPRQIRTVAVALRAGVDAPDLLRYLGLAAGDSLDTLRLRTQLLAFADASPYAAIWLGPGGRGDTVDFAIAAEPRPAAQIGLGVAYDYELGGRLWVGTLDRQTVGRRLTAWTLLAAGRFDQTLRVGLLRPFTVARRSFGVLLNLRVTHLRVRTFDAAGHDLLPIGTRELAGWLGPEHALGGGWEAGAALEGRLWHDPAGDGSALGVRLRLQRVNAFGAPQAGVEASLAGPYRRVVAAARVTALRLAGGRLALAPLVRYGWGRRLPLQLTLPLGGDDGFPGLHLGERRGSRELVAGLDVRWAMAGGVFAIVEGMGGTTDAEGDALPEASWLWGVRGGLGTDTPVGALRVEYGRNSLDRGVVFVRVGEWF